MANPDGFYSTTLSDLSTLVARAIRQHPELEERCIRAAGILLLGRVRHIGADMYEALGADDARYAVDQLAETCECRDFQHRAPVVNGSKCCKHRIAAYFLQELGRRALARRSRRLARVRSSRRREIRRGTRRAA